MSSVAAGKSHYSIRSARIKWSFPASGVPRMPNLVEKTGASPKKENSLLQ